MEASLQNADVAVSHPISSVLTVLEATYWAFGG